MKHTMRRQDRAVSPAEARQILRDAPFMTLAMKGVDGWPYAVVLSFAVEGEKLYFHSAQTGFKVDSLHMDNRVCFTAVERQEPVPETLSVCYRSAVGFGAVRLVTDPNERFDGLLAICKKYAPENPNIERESAGSPAARLYCIDLLELSGKTNS